MCFVLMYYQSNSTKTIITVMWDSVKFFHVKNEIIFENLTPEDDIILEECRARLEGSFSANQ